MHPLFSITKSDIKALNDEQARELVARLCMAELEAQNLSRAAVTWGGNQRAADGGVDVGVETTGPMRAGGYIKAAFTMFQVKAEKYPPAKITGEMKPEPKNELRPIFDDIAANGGSYIIVSTHEDVSALYMKDRAHAMDAALVGSSHEGKIALGFYDAQKMADWASAHPTVTIWVRKIFGKPLQGWKAYGAWAHGETDAAAEFLLDDEVRVFGGGRDGDVGALEAINTLRSVSDETLNIRIVGLSGVGKTRFVQALFDDRLKTPNLALDANMAVYCDFQDEIDPPPMVMLDALTTSTSGSVLVVDNCSGALHSRLAAENSKLKRVKLITVEYDIREDDPENTSFYRLEGASPEIIRKILERRFPILNSVDVRTIVDFSDGNARVALALASTATKGGELASLGDETLFRRLFDQTHGPDGELMRTAEVMSLPYSFDGDDTTPTSELAKLSMIADLPVRTLTRHIGELERRGLLQSRSKWRAVLPHAIANRLAKQALAGIPAAELTMELNTASPRLVRSFARRVGYLHDSKVAQALVGKWIAPGAWLSDLYNLDDFTFEIFRNISPVQPERTLQTIENACAAATDEQLGSSRSTALAGILRSLAYDAVLFDRATRVLVKLSRLEHDEPQQGSSREALRSLFHCFHSGTHASISQRHAIVENLIASTDDHEHQIGLLLLASSLSDHNSAHTLEPEFGARKRDHGLAPSTFEEMAQWYRPFLSLAFRFLREIGANARAIELVLAEALRGLWTQRGLWRELKAEIEALDPSTQWAEGWLALRRIATYDRKHFQEGEQEAIEVLSLRLRPVSLESRIRAKVLGRGSFGAEQYDDAETIDDIEHRNERIHEEAEELGRLAAEDPTLVAGLLSDLFTSQSGGSKILRFGVGLGSADTNHDYMLSFRAVLGQNDRAAVSLVVGFLQAWKQKDPLEVERFLDTSLDDDVWGVRFPMLQCGVGLDSIGCRRLERCVAIGKAPVGQFAALMWGRVTDHLTITEIVRLIDAIAGNDQGRLIAVEVLRMVIACSDIKSSDYREELGAAVNRFLAQLEWARVTGRSGVFDSELQAVIEYGVQAAETFDDVRTAFERLTSFGRSNAGKYREFGQYAGPFFRRFPREALDLTFQIDANGRYTTSLRLVGNALGRHVETPVKNISDSFLLDWAGRDSVRQRFVAETCRLYETPDTDEGDEATSLSSIIISLMRAGTDKAAITNIVFARVESSSGHGPYSAGLMKARDILSATATGDAEVDQAVALYINDLNPRIEAQLVAERDEERGRGSGSFE